MRPSLQFWFEFASTYSYPAAMRVQAAAAARGVAVSWHPFLLGPIFKAQGLSDTPFNLYAAKGRYMWRDLERICGGLELPFKRPSTFPRNSLLAARVACMYSDATWLPHFVSAVYQANFARDEDIALPAVIANCLEQAGQTAAPLLGAAASDDARQRLRQQSESAMALGLFGAPSFVCGTEVFWGNDRLDAALDWCVRETA